MQKVLKPLSALLVSVGFSTTPVHAGEVIIGTGQVHVVTRQTEVLKGSFAGVIVPVNKAHVVLSEAVIDCSSAPTPQIGIHVPSGVSGVHVNGGIVENCNTGILLGDIFVTGDPAGRRNHINGVTVRGAVVSGGTHFDGDAITINNGINNRINGNVVEGYHPIGIRVFRGASNDLAGNRVQNTQAREGESFDAALILQEAVGTSVRDNIITGNTSRGVWAQFNASQNVLTGNTMRDNGGIDAADDSAPCANTWRDNLFGTKAEASEGCVE